MRVYRRFDTGDICARLLKFSGLTRMFTAQRFASSVCSQISGAEKGICSALIFPFYLKLRKLDKIWLHIYIYLHRCIYVCVSAIYLPACSSFVEPIKWFFLSFSLICVHMQKRNQCGHSWLTPGHAICMWFGQIE